MFLDILQKLKSEKRNLSYDNVTIIKEKKSLRQNETLVKGAAGQTLDFPFPIRSDTFTMNNYVNNGGQSQIENSNFDLKRNHRG